MAEGLSRSCSSHADFERGTKTAIGVIWKEREDHAGRAGSPYGVINSRDVTDRVLAEQALEESEKRKAAILETALDAIITIDHDSRVLEFNPAAESMFGLAASEAIGERLDSLIVPLSLLRGNTEGDGTLPRVRPGSDGRETRGD